MTSIGETLRRERLRQGLDLQQVSESTKIGTRMLQAMEVNDFNKLPGGVFTRSFIKQYARALGMDPAALEPELRALQVSGDEGTLFDSRNSEPHTETANRSFSGFGDMGPESNSLLASFVWVVLALLVCGGVYYIMNRAPAPSTASAPAETRPESKPDDKEAPVAAAPVPAAAQAAPEAAQTPPIGTGPVQVLLSATESAWVSVTADGKSAYVGTLQPNEKKEINASDKVKIVAGNAGGLEVSLNGKPLEPLGPKGEVRIVELSAAGVHVIPRTPPNPAPLP